MPAPRTSSGSATTSPRSTSRPSGTSGRCSSCRSRRAPPRPGSTTWSPSGKAALAAAAAAQAKDDIAHAQRTGESSQLQAQLAAQASADLGAGAARDGATVPARAGTLGWPVHGGITSPFGMRVHPMTGVYKLHTGADIGAACGTPIHSALDGVVMQAGWNSAYGWRTVISHGAVDGVLLTTTYNHQTELGVAVGDRVTAGQAIGTVGSTGYSTGCHLHLELYVNAALVDPVPWLPAF